MDASNLTIAAHHLHYFLLYVCTTGGWCFHDDGVQLLCNSAKLSRKHVSRRCLHHEQQDHVPTAVKHLHVSCTSRCLLDLEPLTTLAAPGHKSSWKKDMLEHQMYLCWDAEWPHYKYYCTNQRLCTGTSRHQPYDTAF